MTDPIHARCPGGEVRVFDGPGLLRKPRVGEVLESRRTGARIVVDHFDATNENLCHYRDEKTGAFGLFIWRHPDGLNRLVVHTVTP